MSSIHCFQRKRVLMMAGLSSLTWPSLIGLWDLGETAHLLHIE